MRSSFVILLLAGVACSSAQVGPNGNDPLELEPGTEVVVDDGLKVRLVRVEDSRCPGDVVCVWAGNAKGYFVVTLATGGSAQFALSTAIEPKSIDVLGHRVTLVDIRPGPGTQNAPIPQDQYRATVKVTSIPQP